MESKLEKIIESKHDKKMEAITSLNKNFKGQSIATAETIAEGKTFSEVLKEPKEIKKERRSKNYIIHGLEENGEDPFLNVLLKKI